MGRRGRKQYTPHLRPVERITLSDKHIRWRFAGVICLLFLATGAIGYGMFSFLQTPSGWTEIKVSADAGINCSEEFILQYNLSKDANTELRQLQKLYTNTMETAYGLFNNDSSFEEMTNLYDINQRPNEILTIDPVLYQALETASADETRSLYLAPVYRIWDNLFYCQDDSQLYPFDPVQNRDVKEEIDRMLVYCNAPEHAELEFLGDNRICLKISEAYLNYAETDMGERNFIDFYWTKNAFIIDYAAQMLQNSGLTAGVLSSYDGFTRNLDTNGQMYSYNLYDRQGNHIYPAAVMDYTGPRAMVFLRNYPMNEQDFRHYYELEDGSIRTAFLDSTDGMCKSSTDNILAYSPEKGCGEIVTELLSIYPKEQFSLQALTALADQGIYAVYGHQGVLEYTEKELHLRDFYQSESVRYSGAYVGD